ncbi:ABC transporter ATP-binding protein [Paenibacillus sp. JMULE4]|uniref:ABC transporter ATP-binding protein n=1 Tax=Paenibacillus sp. JMULE4 TaxID=2518342 RepID=UPI001576C5CC|nr:ABC transporter ATP-binding protein [Paenibacillus sp. JMULE4]NTZ18648.1 ABC transporter ATP-binding protein [Paenibacillus sp. JMULE4]
MNDGVKTGKQQPLLEIRNLRVELNQARGKGRLSVLDGVSLSVSKGEIVGIVGESGCGKSVLSLSVLGLLPNAMQMTEGEIWYKGKHPLHQLRDKELRGFRGKELSMVFQDPMSSLNDGLTVGTQVIETLRLHLGCSRKEAVERTVRLFRKVGLSRPEALLSEYPHQLSGGMRQRIMIAMAVSCNPGLLIADEPTTALDVTIQAQILDLMKKIREEDGTSIILISHDLGLVADMCDRIAVMYAGNIVEEGTVDDIFERPRHPYTIGLLHSIPTPAKKQKALYSIPGTVPALQDRGTGCRFAPRCAYATERCTAEAPAFLSIDEAHRARCILAAGEGVKADAVS